MSEWLSKLHEYFLEPGPFVLATITEYRGSSPDLPGACLFYSNSNITRYVTSDDRYNTMIDNAKSVLDGKVQYRTDKLPLGDIAGSDNGYCHVVYEYFETHPYPQWLAELRRHQADGISCTLRREFDFVTGDVQTKTMTTKATNAKATNHNEVQNATQETSDTTKDCVPLQTENSLVLLRNVQCRNILLTLIGDHPVADEIEKQTGNLPINISRCSDATILIDKPTTNNIVIMTTNHELDLQYCETALRQLPATDSFVGCIGSEKKAEVFNTRLKSHGVTNAQLKNFYMPVGLTQIKGKQTSVVAASIIAQILSRHEW